MKIGSISENRQEDKRVAITPDIIKKYKSLGFEINLVENYAYHLGIKDEEYKKFNSGKFSVFFGKKDLVNFVNKSNSEEQETVSFTRKKIFYGLLKSLQIIHDNGYIHLDIKLEQFVTKDDDINKIKLLDFGFTNKIGEKLSSARGRCTNGCKIQ